MTCLDTSRVEGGEGDDVDVARGVADQTERRAQIVAGIGLRLVDRRDHALQEDRLELSWIPLKRAINQSAAQC